jgi:hypothetical protein
MSGDGGPLPDHRDMPGNRSIVQAGLDEARQTLFSAADVPLARTDELLAAVQGPAVRSVLEARIEQIVTHGHTLEQDSRLPIGLITREARDRLQMGCDCLAPPRRNLPIARRRLARAAALLLAAIDQIDLQMKLEPGKSE